MRPVAHEVFYAPVEGGQLSGWVDGAGPNVLLLHGGPGLSADYLNGVSAELFPDYRVALYQQRGLAPSTDEGPFTVGAAVADVGSVLDALGWDKAYVVGHSWGGHLALHVAVRMPHRLSGVLSIDPVGGVGDGGLAGFEAAMLARTPEKNRARAHELDELALRGEGTAAEAEESFALLWPAYFADPATAPPVPPFRVSVAAYSEGYESMVTELPALEQLLSSITIPVGFLVGAASPMPVDLAARSTAERIPHAWIQEVPAAGHFPWMESPGVVRSALDRLTRS